MAQNAVNALKIMGQGMLGIFAAILVIMFAVILLKKIAGGKPQEKK